MMVSAVFLSVFPVPVLLMICCVGAGSPFSVPVSDTVDSTKVKCQGPGLGNNVRANIPQSFTLDASKAGVAPIQVRVQGPKGAVALGPPPFLKVFL